MRRDQRSPEAEAYRRLYKTARWKRARKAQLAQHPLCERHLKRGQVVVATVCHHKEPERKRSEATFYAGPYESLCPECHDGEAQQQERTGYSTAIGSDGWPTDPAHPINRA